MIVPPSMEKIKDIAMSLENEIKALEDELENETCKNKVNELRAEIRAMGLTLFGYQRTLSSVKYGGVNAEIFANNNSAKKWESPHEHSSSVTPNHDD